MYISPIIFAIQIHRLVAIHFVPNPHNHVQVNHIDGNKYNNHSSNLEWVSERENISHSKLNRIGTSKFLWVSYHTKKKKWIGQIYLNGKGRYIGAFKTEIEAAEAVKRFTTENNITNKYA